MVCIGEHQIPPKDRGTSKQTLDLQAKKSGRVLILRQAEHAARPHRIEYCKPWLQNGRAAQTAKLPTLPGFAEAQLQHCKANLQSFNTAGFDVDNSLKTHKQKQKKQMLAGPVA